MALAAIILLLLEKVPYTQLIFCSFQMGSQLGHSKHLPSSFFYSLPSEKDNSFFSSLDSTFNPPYPFSHSGVLFQTAQHWLFLQHATDILEPPKQEWFPSSVAWLGLLSVGVTSLTHWVIQVSCCCYSDTANPKSLTWCCSMSSTPAGLCVK